MITEGIMESKISFRLSQAIWSAMEDIDRSFVRYTNQWNSGCFVWHKKAESGTTLLSVIIPTFDAHRDGYFAHLLRQIDAQEFPEFELIVVRGDPRQGRAINLGAAIAKGKYLLTLDDDTSLPDPLTFTKLVSTLEEHHDIGMAGASNVIPHDARPFVRKVMEQVPRRSSQPVQQITDSDFAEHGCLILRSDAFKAIGGENELLPRGLDPYLRQAFRESGWRVVVVPGVIYHHLPPVSLSRLLRQFYRNGRQAAFVNRHYPQWVIETPAHHGPFAARVPFVLRLLRFPLRLMEALATWRMIWLSCELSYALGFAKGYFFDKNPA